MKTFDFSINHADVCVCVRVQHCVIQPNSVEQNCTVYNVHNESHESDCVDKISRQV